MKRLQDAVPLQSANPGIQLQSSTEARADTGANTDEVLLLTITGSGSVSSYQDTSTLQSLIASLVGIDPSLISIGVTAASVLITATITVPTSVTAVALQSSLTASLPTAAAASAALSMTVVSAPTSAIVIADKVEAPSLTNVEAQQAANAVVLESTAALSVVSDVLSELN